MKKNIPLEKRQGCHGLLERYYNVYLFIAVPVGYGILVGTIVSNYIDVSDIKSLSSYLTAIDSNADKCDYFVLQFFGSIVFILLVLLLRTSLIGIPIISFIASTKGMQISLSCALFVHTYHSKGTAGIIMTLLPQVATDLIVTLLISASVIQLSMYTIYSTVNRERLNFKQLDNNALSDISICFVIIPADNYLELTSMIESTRLSNLM